MKAQEVIRNTAATSAMVLTKYIEDLSDTELLQRPAPGCNHIAWQLGHLISSECQLLNAACPDSAPELPTGFAEKHSKEAASDDSPANFCSKEEYLELFEKCQAATATATEKLSEEDLDKPAPEHFQPMFPTIGHLLVLIATHPMMHVGQFVPLRRALDKPVVI